MTQEIRIILADDHGMIRQGIKQLLELEPDLKVVATACNGEEAVSLAINLCPDVLLMDINMPVKNGLVALEEIKKSNLPIKVIMLTIHRDKEYLFKTLNLGADGFILKDAEPHILIDAIRNVVKGESYIQPIMLKELVTEFNNNSSVPKSCEESLSLTAREIEVLKLIAEGFLNKQIASTLFISEKTVKNHVSAIFRKLNVTDRTQAAIFALKNNIVGK